MDNMALQLDSAIQAEILVAKQKELAARKKVQTRYFILGVASVLCFLLIWQLVVSLRLIDTKFLESPVGVIRILFIKLTNKSPDGALLTDHIFSSLSVVLSGFLLATAIGVPLGLFMGWYPLCDRFVRPVFEIIRPIPTIAWIPIIVLFLGIGLQAKAVIIFFSAFIAILINTYAGIKSTNPVFINVAKTYGVSNFRIFLHVGIPSALPMVFAGLRIAIGTSWSAVVAAEMLAASRGLGYMISLGRTYMRVDLIMGGILVIGFLGLIFSGLFSIIEDKALKWRPKK